MRHIAIHDLLASEAEMERLRTELAAGGVAAIPTETFYGLAADPTSEEGVRRVVALKGRGDDKPLLVLFARRQDLASLAVAAAPARLERYFAIWPAPLTVVLPLSHALPASRGQKTLGVRVPAHEPLRRLLARIGPVTGTSLNRSGEAPCEDAEDVTLLFGDRLDVFVDGGRTPGGQPSTVVDATREPPRLLREGAFAWPPGAEDTRQR